MKKFALICLILFLSSFAFAKTQKEEYQNDYLYSAEYFDYLIECAEVDRELMLKKEKEMQEEIITEESLSNTDDIIVDDFTPFKLKIEENVKTSLYKDSFKKIDSKTIIPIADSFSIIQDMSKTRNKYNSNDYKMLSGAEFHPFKYFTLSSGLETNFRGLDQNPTSRKLYLTPELSFKDKVSIKFHNKMNISDYSSDHDIGLNVSPFKSKVVDFGMYSGLTRKHNGVLSESINFSTNFYF